MRVNLYFWILGVLSGHSGLLANCHTPIAFRSNSIKDRTASQLDHRAVEVVAVELGWVEQMNEGIWMGPVYWMPRTLCQAKYSECRMLFQVALPATPPQDLKEQGMSKSHEEEKAR